MAEGSSTSQQPAQSSQQPAAQSSTTNSAQSSTTNSAGKASSTSPVTQGESGTKSPIAAQSDTAQPGVRRVEAGALVLSFYTARPADTRASKLIGQEVYNLNNENIGEVSDLIIDNGKTIKAIVVSVGGFLGLGERNVALDPASVVLSEMQDGSARMVVNTTKEQLKNAPAFDFAEVDKAGPNAGQTTTGSGASGSQPAQSGTTSTNR
jgi:sporulation protein YlmC with PRC-barrel domain